MSVKSRSNENCTFYYRSYRNIGTDFTNYQIFEYSIWELSSFYGCPEITTDTRWCYPARFKHVIGYAKPASPDCELTKEKIDVTLKSVLIWNPLNRKLSFRSKGHLRVCPNARLFFQAKAGHLDGLTHSSSENVNPHTAPTLWLIVFTKIQYHGYS